MLLDNANLISPSVLDRLNPLLEQKGKLVLDERGHVNGKPVVITPHPDFRLNDCSYIIAMYKKNSS